MSEKFDADRHIRNVLGKRTVNLTDPAGIVLAGVEGVEGAAEKIDPDIEIGVDRLVMQPGSAFELHTHPGAHLLYVLRARGLIHVDGVDYEIGPGDTIFVPARYAHGVRTRREAREPFELLAFGVPHMPLTSPERMTLVDEALPAADSTPGGPTRMGGAAHV
ncbi:cupin domain-containing protein [Streptomyces sp. NPDC051662]|uniref:cupin domain-containing protein n=1 Tax=Streptomyces sp. NPDC051662 TaxID=3154750 RepID=UPI00341F351E